MNQDIEELVFQWRKMSRTEKGTELDMCTKQWSYLSRMASSDHMFSKAIMDTTIDENQEVLVELQQEIKLL